MGGEIVRILEKVHDFVGNSVDSCLMSAHENFELLVKRGRKCFVSLPSRVENKFLRFLMQSFSMQTLHRQKSSTPPLHLGL